MRKADQLIEDAFSLPITWREPDGWDADCYY